jgi:NADH-quinone oxidoreductase subunit L
MAASSVIVLAGIGIGWWFYGRMPIDNFETPDAIGKMQPSLFAALGNGLYIDGLYAATVLRLNAWVSATSAWFDRWIWSGVVQLVSYLILGLAYFDNIIDTGFVNRGFDGGCRCVSRGGRILSSMQDGRIQIYLRLIGAALVALVIFLLWGSVRG